MPSIKQKLLSIAVLVLSLTALNASAFESGVVKTLKGSAHVKRGSSSIDLSVGAPVQQGDRLQVGPDGALGISMNDETLLTLGPNSVLVIDQYAYDPVTREGKVETSILRGTLRFITGMIGMGNPQSVKVRTNTATIGIRGTDFIVEVPDVK